MILYHWTTPRAWKRVQASGLDPRCSRGKAKCVWLLEAAQALCWLPHVADKQQVEPWDMILLAVSVPRNRVTPAGRGRFKCWTVIPAVQLWFLGHEN